MCRPIVPRPMNPTVCLRACSSSVSLPWTGRPSGRALSLASSPATSSGARIAAGTSRAACPPPGRSPGGSAPWTTRPIDGRPCVIHSASSSPSAGAVESRRRSSRRSRTDRWRRAPDPARARRPPSSSAARRGAPAPRHRARPGTAPPRFPPAAEARQVERQVRDPESASARPAFDTAPDPARSRPASARLSSGRHIDIGIDDAGDRLRSAAPSGAGPYHS